MSDYKIGWPLADAFLIELGRLSALWGTLEFSLNILIGRLAGFADINDPIPFILTVHSSFPQRLDAFVSLCKLHLPNQPSLARYQEVLGLVETAQKSRNKFIHTNIVYDAPSKKHMLLSGSARRSLKTTLVEVNSQDIHDACKAVHLASLAIHELSTGKKHKPKWD